MPLTILPEQNTESRVLTTYLSRAMPHEAINKDTIVLGKIIRSMKKSVTDIPNLVSLKPPSKYTFDSVKKYYGLTAKDDWKDRIQIEIGDSKDSSKFRPQLKIMRWDNEVNFSIRLTNFDNYKLETAQEKIKLINDTKEVHFYDYPKGHSEYPEGGYEFEVILKEKPASNKFIFTIQTKELNFFYQPPLTKVYKNGYSKRFKKQIVVTETQVRDLQNNVLVNCPENVVGSFAAYHKSKGRFNKSSGKDYKVGKAFHIYRPKAIDNRGHEIWGELNIDLAKNQLYVIIDQNWLGNAVYPVAVDPTFGQTSKGALSTTGGTDWFLSAKFTPSDAGGTVDSMSLWCDSAGTVHFKPLVVLNSTLNIITNGIGPAGTVPASSTSPLQVDYVSKPTVTQVAYQLGFVQESTFNIYYDTGVSGDGLYDLTNSYATPSNPTDASLDNFIYSIFATYTGAGTTYSRGSYASLPANDADLTTIYSAQDVTDVSSSNNVRVGQLATGQYAIHQYKNDVGNKTTATLTWEGQSDLATTSSTIYMQIYNRTTTTWTAVNSDNGHAANIDFTITGNIADLTNYKDASNIICCRVYQQAV